MEKITFELRAGDEYIALSDLLKLTNAVESGGMVKVLLGNEAIKLNGKVISERKKKIRANDVVRLGNDVEIKVLAVQAQIKVQSLELNR